MKLLNQGFLRLLILMGLLLGWLGSTCRGSVQLTGAENQLSKATRTAPAPSATGTFPHPSPVPTQDGSSFWTAEPSLGAPHPDLPERSTPMIIHVVYDNHSAKPGLESAWGFAALVEHEDERVLFDTGGSGSTLLSNMGVMEIDPKTIDTVVLSHIHKDHTGGLPLLLAEGVRPAVLVLPSFSTRYKQGLESQVDVVEVTSNQRISPRIYTTGEIPGSPPEQALVLDTTEGLIILTGCAHPGIEQIVRQVKRTYQEEIYLVMGGFHLGGASPGQVKEIIRSFQGLGVLHVAPCHCTGTRAMALFEEAYGDHYLDVGAGTVIVIEDQ